MRGEPVESILHVHAGDTSKDVTEKVPTHTSQTNHARSNPYTPEAFPDRFLFIRVFNEIHWSTKNRERK